jgi:hypothetical protein
MKEVSRKFSADDNESPNPSGRLIPQPVRDGRPMCRDLRFVVKESLNLGFRWFDEVDRMLQKFKEDEPEKKAEPENKEGEEEATEPS